MALGAWSHSIRLPIPSDYPPWHVRPPARALAFEAARTIHVRACCYAIRSTFSTFCPPTHVAGSLLDISPTLTEALWLISECPWVLVDLLYERVRMINLRFKAYELRQTSHTHLSVLEDDQQEIRSGNGGLVGVNQGLFLHRRSMYVIAILIGLYRV